MASRAERVWLACNHSLYEDVLETTRVLKENKEGKKTHKKNYDKLQLNVKTSHERNSIFVACMKILNEKKFFNKRTKEKEQAKP